MEAVFLAGAVQALFFAIIVLNKKNKQIADNILGIWLTTLTITLFCTFLIYREGTLYNSVLLSIILGLMASQPVWFYLYTCSLSDKSTSFRIVQLLHFIPAIVVVLLFIPFFKLEGLQVEEIYNRTESLPKLVVFGSAPLMGLIYIYIILALLKIRAHKKNLKYIFSYEEEVDLKWLLRLTYSFLIILAFSVVMFGLFYFTDSKNGLIYDYLSGASYVGFVFALGYFGYRQGSIFSHSNRGPQIPSKKSVVSESTSGMNRAVEEDAEFATQLNNYTITHKPWLNQELSLYDLARELDLTSHQLSSLLNDYLKTSFYDYINHHRVEEVKKRLRNNNKRLTILAIALDCGFNSKASFNRVFKQKTGSTPSEYQKANNL